MLEAFFFITKLTIMGTKFQSPPNHLNFDYIEIYIRFLNRFTAVKHQSDIAKRPLSVIPEYRLDLSVENNSALMQIFHFGEGKHK